MGVVAINKPAGLTSHDVVAQLRRITGIKQVGHTGTLDPFATGLLLVMVGAATRLAEYAHNAHKIYETTVTLGATSTTDDGTGTITVTQPMASESTAQQIEKVLQQFIGEIDQVPPHYAAIKVGGKKLYEYARTGEQVLRQARRVRIDHIEILEYRYPNLRLRVTCGSGTYIRALARDIGQALGGGGYASALQRIAIGSIKIEQAAGLDSLEPQTWQTQLLPPTVLLEHMPQTTVSSENVVQLKQGRGVQFTNDVPDSNLVALLDPFGQLVGIGQYDVTTKQLLPRKIL